MSSKLRSMLFVCVWLFLFGAALIFFHLSVIKTGWLRRAFVRSVKEKNSSWLGVPGLDNVFNMWRYLYTEYLSSDTSWWTFEQQHALNLTVIYLISLEMEKRYIHRFFSVLTPLWIALVQLMPRSITLPLLFSTYALALRHKGFDETSYVMVRHAAYYSLIPVSVPIICLSFLSMASYPFRDILLFLIHLWPPLSSLFVLIAPSRAPPSKTYNKETSFYVSLLFLFVFSSIIWFSTSAASFLYCFKVGFHELYHDIFNVWLSLDQRTFVAFDFIFEVVSLFFFVWHENGILVALLSVAVGLLFGPSAVISIYFVFREGSRQIQRNRGLSI